LGFYEVVVVEERSLGTWRRRDCGGGEKAMRHEGKMNGVFLFPRKNEM